MRARSCDRLSHPSVAHGVLRLHHLDHSFRHDAGLRRPAVSRSCLIFESKTMPRDRCTEVDVFCSGSTGADRAGMDMYNRVRPCDRRREHAEASALLTTAYPLLIPRSTAVRVRSAARRIFSTPSDKECSMSNVQWKDSARRARWPTPHETEAGRNPHRMEHPGGSLARRRSEAFDGPATRTARPADSWKRSSLLIQGDCRE